MILDKKLLCWDKATVVDATPSDIVDLEGNRPGPGEPLMLMIQGFGLVPAALDLIVEHSDTTTPGDFEELLTLPATDMSPGENNRVSIPNTSKRYIRLLFGTLVPTAGEITAGIWYDMQSNS